jgi:hypothetical protein
VSDDNTDHENLDTVFTSTESSVQANIPSDKNKLSNEIKMDTNQNQIKSTINNSTLNATTGMDVFENDMANFIDEDNGYNQDFTPSIDSSRSNSPVGTGGIPPNKKPKKESIGKIVENMLKKDDKNMNGWDNDANLTITNWYKTLKQQSFIYQFVLDKNKKISDRLAIISIISSASLGIFSGFKLWVNNDTVFQTISNILLMLFNFIVALITAASKRYIDDKRNETIRAYVEEIDIFIGELSAQVLNSPVYRMNADKFFKQNNNKYTKLISSAPNLSLKEINDGKKQFNLYIEHCHYNV